MIICLYVYLFIYLFVIDSYLLSQTSSVCCIAWLKVPSSFISNMQAVSVRVCVQADFSVCVRADVKVCVCSGGVSESVCSGRR